jgi:hypothetical protein
MKRREFIAGLGATAAAPLGARAQQGERIRRIGIVAIAYDGISPFSQRLLASLKQGLAELGWVEGQNLRMDSPEARNSSCWSVRRKPSPSPSAMSRDGGGGRS